MKNFHLVSLCCLALSTLFLAADARAAEPGSGRLATDTDTPSVSWTGGPYRAGIPSPLGCVSPLNPACDAFALTVDLPPEKRFVVAVTSEVPGDDYDLYVYYPDGSEAGRSTTSGDTEAVVVEHTTEHGTGPYKVRVLPYAVSAGSSYTGLAREASGGATVEPEDPNACLEAVPAAVGVAGLTDSGQTVSLDVAVLLDGIALAEGDQILARAAEAYAPLHIALHAVSYTPVSFSGTEGTAMIQQAKDFFGGVRPAGADVVFVLTSKDITSDGDTSLAGLADCIGGVRFPNHAFAVGEGSGNPPLPVGPFFLSMDAHPEVVAHEIGHLMGVQHHYANCVEGNLSSSGPGDLSPCTLMFNYVELQSLNFGTLEGAVARGHAVQFAAP